MTNFYLFIIVKFCSHLHELLFKMYYVNVHVPVKPNTGNKNYFEPIKCIFPIASAINAIFFTNTNVFMDHFQALNVHKVKELLLCLFNMLCIFKSAKLSSQGKLAHEVINWPVVKFVILWVI